MDGPAQPLPRPTPIPNIALRACGEADLPFLHRVYADARAAELALVTDWTEAQRQDFLRFQFDAQHRHYHEHYPDADFDLILAHGRPVGRLYVCDLGEEVRLMDIALLAVERNRGLGTALMRMLMDRAAARGKPLSLHVEDENPAKRLYLRLGFREGGRVSFYRRMDWHPPAGAAAGQAIS
jgi:GNAT superfamily N-acetyltransferase